jgi:hypothetical protein
MGKSTNWGCLTQVDRQEPIYGGRVSLEILDNFLASTWYNTDLF